MTEDQGNSAANSRPPRERSPSFPFISLSASFDRLREFEEKFGRNPPPADRVYLAWGYKGDTSQAQQTLAALKSFGIVDYSGSGKKRSIVITDDARTFIRAQQDHIKKDIVRKLAIRPPVFQEFWEKWGVNRPPDEICLDTLVLEHRFNERTAPVFLKVYDATIAYAGLDNSDKVEEPYNKGEEDVPPPLTINVGDLIQVEIDGELKLQSPARVRGKTEHEGIEWIFIDGTETGFPLEQVVLEKTLPGVAPPTITAPTLPLDGVSVPIAKGIREDKASLDEGEVVMRWPEELSADSVADLEYWMQGIINRAKRRAGK